MARIDIDPRTAERLVSGRVGPDEMPPGADRVALVLDAARVAATESDLSALDATVAAMVDAAATSAGLQPVLVIPSAPRTRTVGPRAWLPRLLTASVAGLTAVFGGLAVAGALPSAAQRPVADLASHVGIDLPRPADAPKGPASATPTSTTSTSTTSTTVVPGETTATTAVTTETTIGAAPCQAPAVITATGCLPAQEPSTSTSTTSTTQPPPPPTTSTTAVQTERSSQEAPANATGDHSGTANPGVS